MPLGGRIASHFLNVVLNFLSQKSYSKGITIWVFIIKKIVITAIINYQNLVIGYFAYILFVMHFQIMVMNFNNLVIDYFHPKEQSSNCNKI